MYDFVLKFHDLLLKYHDFVLKCHDFVLKCHNFTLQCHDLVLEHNDSVLKYHDFVLKRHDFERLFFNYELLTSLMQLRIFVVLSMNECLYSTFPLSQWTPVLFHKEKTLTLEESPTLNAVLKAPYTARKAIE